MEEESDGELLSVPLASAGGSRRPCPSPARRSGAVERTPASRRLVHVAELGYRFLAFLLVEGISCCSGRMQELGEKAVYLSGLSELGLRQTNATCVSCCNSLPLFGAR